MEALAITKQELLTNYSPKILAKEFKGITTVRQALSTQAQNLYALRNNVGEEKVCTLMKVYLIELNEVLGLKQPFSEAQIEAIAEEIVGMYSCLTMADVHLIFKRIKTGYYGNLYDRLPPPQMLGFFKEYFDERCEEAERQSVNEANTLTGMGAARFCDKEKEAWRIARLMNFERMVKK